MSAREPAGLLQADVELRCLREGLQRQREAIERQGKQLVLLRAMLGREDDK